MTSIPQEIQQWLTKSIGSVDSFQTVGGGCINNTASLKSRGQSYFIKWNGAKEYPNMFKAEANGLKLLQQSTLKIPDVIDNYEGTDYSCLLLEHIKPSRTSNKYWQLLGEGLANQHKITNQTYGLSFDNYMGSLKQKNTPSESWIEFFILNRLSPQVAIARNNGLIDNNVTEAFEKLYPKLDNLLIEESPALLHGDLWNGNIMTDNNGLPALIDPAVYFGNREVDLAMTRLFGGFDQEFYQTYQSIYPTSGDLEARIDLYNLYPLLIHLNLFGRGYLGQIVLTVNRFV